MSYSIVWKIREKGVVVFRRDYGEDSNIRDLKHALETFRKEEPDAYIVRAYKHEPIDPNLLAGLIDHLREADNAYLDRMHAEGRPVRD